MRRVSNCKFQVKFWALSKDVDFRPCASAQGRDGKEDEGCGGVRARGSDPIGGVRVVEYRHRGARLPFAVITQPRIGAKARMPKRLLIT